MIPDSITIFTDGSSRGNPGPGGFGAIVIAPNNDDLGFMIYELGGYEEHTTNNRMELQAVISVLSFIRKSGFVNPKSIFVYCDSSYVINGITKWVFGWQKNGWKTGAKKNVENRDLWEKLLEAVRGKKIEWKQIGGHVGVAGNERCDEIATAFADGKSIKLYSGILENYGIKNILEVRQGSTLNREKGRTLSRNRSKAKAYSYVSAVDGKIMTHKTWVECEQRVKGKSGAKYNKALSEEDERAIIASWG